VPVVPWEGPPAARGLPINCQKGRHLFGRRKVHPERENNGYAYEKKDPRLTLVWGHRMVNPALKKWDNPLKFQGPWALLCPSFPPPTRIKDRYCIHGRIMVSSGPEAQATAGLSYIYLQY